MDLAALWPHPPQRTVTALLEVEGSDKSKLAPKTALLE